MSKILIVLTSHTALGDTGRPTGFHFEELAAPYYAFMERGMVVDIASIQGGPTAHDPSSLHDSADKRPATVQRFLADQQAMGKLAATYAVRDLEGAIYDGIFLPGGHGTMWDFASSEKLAELIGGALDRGAVVGAVCHGPAGLLGAKTSDGRPVVAGRRVNAFTNAEEDAIGATAIMPFSLETRLRDLGGLFDGGPNFAGKVVRDGNLVTGQNPQSSSLVAEEMLSALGARKAA